MTEVIQSNTELCPNCQKNKASVRKNKFCTSCYMRQAKADADAKRLAREAAKESVPLANIAGKMALSKTTEDWQRLAKEVEPTVKGILDGSIDATAAQASLIKTILDRAYGKPVATQSEKKIAAGVVILPTLGSGENMMICPMCGHEAKANLVSE